MFSHKKLEPKETVYKRCRLKAPKSTPKDDLVHKSYVKERQGRGQNRRSKGQNIFVPLFFIINLYVRIALIKMQIDHFLDPYSCSTLSGRWPSVHVIRQYYHLQLCETFFSVLQVLAEGPLGGQIYRQIYQKDRRNKN